MRSTNKIIFEAAGYTNPNHRLRVVEHSQNAHTIEWSQRLDAMGEPAWHDVTCETIPDLFQVARLLSEALVQIIQEKIEHGKSGKGA